MNTVIPRPEHPRPDFMRDTFFNLNGVWQFAFDDEARLFPADGNHRSICLSDEDERHRPDG